MLFSFYILISYMFFILQDFQGLWAKDCTTSLSWGGLNHICWNCTILCGLCNSLGCVSACSICLDRPRYPRKINLLPMLFCFYSLPPPPPSLSLSHTHTLSLSLSHPPPCPLALSISLACYVFLPRIGDKFPYFSSVAYETERD